jgi:hypothetical protein
MNARSIAAPAVILAAAGCDLSGCDPRLLDACQKARDLASFVGTEIAASNPTGNIVIGESDAHHATGLVSIAVRASSVAHSAPRLNGVVLRPDSTTASSAYPVDDRRDTGFTFDFSAGGFRGFRLGDTRVGALDVLGNVVILPTFDAGDFRSRPNGIGFGLGVRLGVIGETRVLPAVSVSMLARAMPTFTMKSDPLPMADGGTARINLESLRAHAYLARVAASKKIGRVGLTAGVGLDRYRASAEYRVTEPDLGTDSDVLSVNGPHSNRSVLFAGASVPLGKATLAVEAGRVSAPKDLHLLNTFVGSSMTKARTFVTFGMRIPAGRTLDRGR